MRRTLVIEHTSLALSLFAEKAQPSANFAMVSVSHSSWRLEALVGVCDLFLSKLLVSSRLVE